MLEIIQGLNSGASLILVILVIANPSGFNKKANFYLGLFLFSLFIQLFDEMLDTRGVYESIPYLSFIPILLLLSMPVLLYVGILHYLDSERKISTQDSKFFLVPFLFILATLIYSILNGNTEIFNRESEGTTQDVYSIFFLAQLLQIIFFWVKGHRLLSQHSIDSREYSAAEGEVDLSWLKQFHYIYLVMVVSWFLSEILITDWMFILANVLFLLATFMIAYNAMKQKAVFPEDKYQKQEIQSFLGEKSETKPSLGSPEDKLLQERILDLMADDKSFLDNDLNLAKLATALDSSTHQVSSVLNNAIGKSFSHFINDFRVDEAKTILTDPHKKHYTMLQVAYEAGFNSKTVFNTYFKKSTGNSPSAFKKNNNAPKSQ